MTHLIDDSSGDSPTPADGPTTSADVGPDPVVGAGISLFGIFLMGAGGAGDQHYVFDAGVLVAVGGAALFVLLVSLSAFKQRSARR